MNILFLDESGNHALDPIDPDYPVFVLGGVIFERTYYRTIAEPLITDFKRTWFDNEDIILHTADIVRQKNGFENLTDPTYRNQFYEGLNSLMSTLRYEVVASVINKISFHDQYGKNSADPYHLCLEFIVERLCRNVLDSEDSGFIIAEKRNPQLDNELELAWQILRKQGTLHCPKDSLNEKIIELCLKDKKLNIAGLQLADLVVSPIGRAVLGKPTRQDWDIVESRFIRTQHEYKGIGLKIFP